MRLKLFLLGLLACTTVQAEEKLIFAVDIIRHGDRTPTVELPKSPYHWAQGLGELTATGMNQELQNGISFRKVYVDQYHLLPANYQSDAMYVRSTDMNRTLMSADSVLLGLYPLGSGPALPSTASAPPQSALPSAYQPIPIHTVPVLEDHLLMYHDSDGSFKKKISQYVFTRQDWIDKTKQYQSRFARWTQLTGVPINGLIDITLLGDDLYIRKLYHVPFPSGMTDKEADEIIELSKFAFTTAYKPYEIGKYASRELLQTIANYFKQAINHQTSLKYYLGSAHDGTILGVMSAMATPLSAPPPYASDLKFLLFENEGHYSVQISYNGNAVLLPACRYQNCTWEDFVRMVGNTA